MAKITAQDIAEWASAAMVFATGGLAGHYAAAGMNTLQWAGAVTAVLGSVTVAVAVRVWQPKTAAETQRD